MPADAKETKSPAEDGVQMVSNPIGLSRETHLKMKSLSAFSLKKRPDDSDAPSLSSSEPTLRGKLLGAAGFMKNKAKREKEKLNRTGIHNTLEVIRRTSVEVLERLREEESTKKQRMEAAKKKKRKGRENLDDDDDCVYDVTPPLFPEDFLFSENYGYFKKTWTLGVLLLVVFSTIIIPMEFAFPNETFTPDAIATIIDIIFIIDVVLSFRTAYTDANGEEVFDKESIKRNYMKTWFSIDLIACFPLELLVSLWNNQQNSAQKDDAKAKILLRLLKFPRLLRMGRLFKYLERMKYAGCWRIFRLILGLVIVAHWTACVFYALLQDEFTTHDGQTWDLYVEDYNNRVGTGDQYINALYAALSMLIGEGVDPNTPLQKMFAFAINIFGAVVMAIIIGNMSLVLQNKNAMSSIFSSKVDQVADCMRAMKVSPKLQEKVLGYYDYLWQRHRLVSTHHSFVDELSPCLQNEVNLDLNMDVIQKCGLFRSLLMNGKKLEGMMNQEIADHILVQVVTNLGREVYLPQDVIIQQGETGREMFFLIKGDVAVEQMSRFDENGEPITKRLVVLHEGAYFGELALLKEHARRAASIVALTPCDVRVLRKVDFDQICDDFPALRQYLQAEADRKYAKFAPKKEAKKTVEKRASAKLLNLMKAKKGITPPKMSLTPKQTLVAKMRTASPKLPPVKLDSSSGNIDNSLLTSLYTQNARIETMLASLLDNVQSMDRRMTAIEGKGIGGGQVNSSKKNSPEKTFLKSPPNGRSPTVRSVLSEEHRQKLHHDVRQAETNARAVSILRRASFSPQRSGRSNSTEFSQNRVYDDVEKKD